MEYIVVSATLKGTHNGEVYSHDTRSIV